MGPSVRLLLAALLLIAPRAGVAGFPEDSAPIDSVDYHCKCCPPPLGQPRVRSTLWVGLFLGAWPKGALCNSFIYMSLEERGCKFEYQACRASTTLSSDVL